MRTSREQAAQTRERIVETAARLYRERGINGIGVADLMNEAGLTHGGFYKHFESKEALIAEACAAALEATKTELRRKIAAAPDDEALSTLVHTYLSKAHSDNPGLGCTIATLGPEAIRQDGIGKETIQQGVNNLLALISTQLQREGVDNDEVEAKAHAVLASMIGGLLLSRMMDSPTKTKAVLRDTSDFILKSV
ncbi:TetR/AcrR family transcriptional regulator [Undibacterium sp. CY18W]|uniref:TetR/AcrR family transcriptional regulator n=1 Tax=Undibacterium hunanense TaxID=2762292 RepID=A0ABR6ZM70_9BURK|nr:TetR/AcrR family transcriptional regulator [Undibacterium hunanense]MBC3916987.1 TetR/AcrR family transcriptional regulator [Undibacterium hunanense]